MTTMIMASILLIVFARPFRQYRRERIIQRIANVGIDYACATWLDFFIIWYFIIVITLCVLIVMRLLQFIGVIS